MKVKDLIKTLEQFEPDTEVYAKDWGMEDNEFHDIRRILWNYDKEGNKVVQLLIHDDLIELEVE
jgi:hypothetical protein